MTKTAWPPFPDTESANFTLTKQVNQAQLHHELEEALGVPIQLSTSKTPGEDEETLWLVPGDVAEDTVQQVIDDHEPDQEWGVPKATRDYFALLRKVSEDPDTDLTAEEIQTAVKGILLRPRS